MPRVASLCRHPIKAIGREEVTSVALVAGQTLPGDRAWAVAHDSADVVSGEWTRCGNFIRAASSPALMAVTLTTEGETVHLRHPDRPDLSITLADVGSPDGDAAQSALIKWLTPLVTAGRPAPARLIKAPDDHGMTDTSAPSISLASTASHDAVAAKAVIPMSRYRWRCNIWIDDTPAWEEFTWQGKTLRIGEAEVEVYKRLDRCMATTANPDTGERDIPVLDILKGFGHQDFSVGLKVTRGGKVSIGDKVDLI